LRPGGDTPATSGTADADAHVVDVRPYVEIEAQLRALRSKPR
jgi:hypothetical protein